MADVTGVDCRPLPASARRELAEALQMSAALGCEAEIKINPAVSVALAAALEADAELMLRTAEWRMQAALSASRAADDAARSRRVDERLMPWVLGVWASVLGLGVWGAFAPLVGW